MPSLKFIRVGKSVGLILPREFLARVGLKERDCLDAIEIRNGIELVPCESEFAAQLDVAAAVMAEDRGTRRKLAE